MRIALLLSTLLFVSCQASRISVLPESLGHDSLASFHVRTPDPKLDSSYEGSRLNFFWDLSDQKELDDASLLVTVLLGDYSLQKMLVPIEEKRGRCFYELTQDDYTTHKGIRSYKVDIFQGGELLDSWQHRLWTQLITFDKNEDIVQK